MAGTVLPTLTAAQFAARLARLFPNGWASPDAMQTGNLAGLLNGEGGLLAQVLAALTYAKNSILIGTATAPELDLASKDFFGDALPRPAGMSDAAFAALIKSNLFPRVATRPAISAALVLLTGKTPRMMEPWNPGDMGAWGATNSAGKPVSYWGVDTAANPARWSPTNLRFVGFIDSAQPLASVGGVLPGGYWGATNSSGYPTQFWSTGAAPLPPAYGFMSVEPTGGTVAGLLEQLRAYGVTLYYRIVTNPQ